MGVAKQRKAIVDGLRTSIVDFNDNVEGSNTKDVMDLLLLTQVRHQQLLEEVQKANWTFVVKRVLTFKPSCLFVEFSSQYFDMIRDVGGSGHCRTTFIPASRTDADEIRNAMLQADSQK